MIITISIFKSVILHMQHIIRSELPVRFKPAARIEWINFIFM